MNAPRTGIRWHLLDGGAPIDVVAPGDEPIEAGALPVLDSIIAGVYLRHRDVDRCAETGLEHVECPCGRSVAWSCRACGRVVLLSEDLTDDSSCPHLGGAA